MRFKLLLLLLVMIMAIGGTSALGSSPGGTLWVQVTTDKNVYQEGESLTITIRSGGGFLYLEDINDLGRIKTLFPLFSSQDNYIPSSFFLLSCASSIKIFPGRAISNFGIPLTGEFVLAEFGASPKIKKIDKMKSSHN